MRTMYDNIKKSIEGGLYRDISKNYSSTLFIKKLKTMFTPVNGFYVGVEVLNLTENKEGTLSVLGIAESMKRIKYRDLTQNEANVLAYYERKQSELEKRIPKVEPIGKGTPESWMSA